MQVNEIEINGFYIDEFNQHDLKVGDTQGTCPLCSFNRKPENRKAKCASYDWDRGLGTCHNCDKSFQLHTYKRKGKAEKEYVKPPEKKIKPVGGDREISVNVRIISATNKDIEKMIKEDSFRIDLYHRINTLVINIPPLRERPEDIEPLFKYYISYFARKKKKVTPQISS